MPADSNIALKTECPASPGNKQVLLVFIVCIAVGGMLLGIISTSEKYALLFLVGLGALVASAVCMHRPEYGLLMWVAWLPFELFFFNLIPDSAFRYATAFSTMVPVFLILLLIARSLQQRKRIKVFLTPIDVPLIIYGAVMVLSALMNEVPFSRASLGIRAELRFVPIYYFVVFSRLNKSLLKKLVIVTLLTASVEIIIGLAQAIAGTPLLEFFAVAGRGTEARLLLSSVEREYVEAGRRIFGTLRRFNVYGNYLAIVLPIAIGLATRYKRKLLQLFIWLGSAAIVLSYSRESWLGLLAAIVLNFLLSKQYTKVKIVIVSGLLFVVALVVFRNQINQVYAHANMNLMERLVEPFSAGRVNSSYDGRIRAITFTADLVTKTNLLFGIGPGNFGVALLGMPDEFLLYKYSIPQNLALNVGDNNWLAFWAQGGLLGLVAFGWAAINLLRASAKAYSQSNNEFLKYTALGIAGALLSFLIVAFFTPAFSERTYVSYFWIFGGVGVRIASKTVGD